MDFTTVGWKNIFFFKGSIFLHNKAACKWFQTERWWHFEGSLLATVSSYPPPLWLNFEIRGYHSRYTLPSRYPPLIFLRREAPENFFSKEIPNKKILLQIPPPSFPEKTGQGGGAVSGVIPPDGLTFFPLIGYRD